MPWGSALAGSRSKSFSAIRVPSSWFHANTFSAFFLNPYITPSCCVKSWMLFTKLPKERSLSTSPEESYAFIAPPLKHTARYCSSSLLPGKLYRNLNPSSVWNLSSTNLLLACNLLERLILPYRMAVTSVLYSMYMLLFMEASGSFL